MLYVPHAGTMRPSRVKSARTLAHRQARRLGDGRDRTAGAGRVVGGLVEGLRLFDVIVL